MVESEQKNDPYQLGLAAYAKKNFGEAGKLFEESAVGKARRVQEASTTAKWLTDEAIRDFRLAGDAHTNNYHFDQALIAYQKARELTSKGDNPRLRTDHTILVGNAEQNIGTRTEGDRIHHHLGKAVAAYRASVEIRTREHLPEGWAQTHNNLAKAALALEDWPTAVESYRDVLTLYPDYNEAYQMANVVYHERLFAYPSAFELSKQWVERHPNDLAAQANFAEAHLTTGLYGEAERRLAELLKKPDLDPSSSVGLRVVGIVSALALKKDDAVPQKLQELRTFVSGQPESVQVAWSFDGTKHYVQTEEIFARYRPWLIELFSITESKDRATLLTILDRMQVGSRP